MSQLWSLLCLTALLVGCTSGQSLDDALERAEQRLNELTSRLVGLTDGLEASDVDATDARVTTIGLAKKLNCKEGVVGACAKGYFPCGFGQYGSVKCISQILVCDGTKDCDSGADETCEMCDVSKNGCRDGQAIDLVRDQLLISLASRFDDINKQLDQGLVLEYAARSGLRKLDEKEGKVGPCDKGYFPCGQGPVGGVQCISDILVCDGSADCKSGADEDAERCEMPFRYSVTIPSVTTRDSCSSADQGMPLRPTNDEFPWVINSANIVPWFPSRPQLTWVYRGRSGSMPGFGTYNYATGDFYLDFGETQRTFGMCRNHPISPTRPRYICDLSNSFDVLDSGEQTCYQSATVWDKY